MPELRRHPRQIGRRVTGTARKMTMNLKSLCDATAWDVFLVGDGGIDQLNNVCQSNNAGVKEPTLDLKSIYTSGTCARIDHWDDYLYHPDEASKPTTNALETCSHSSQADIYRKSDRSPQLDPGATKRKNPEAQSSPFSEADATRKHPRPTPTDHHPKTHATPPPTDRTSTTMEQTLALEHALRPAPAQASPSIPPCHTGGEGQGTTRSLSYDLLLYALYRDPQALSTQSAHLTALARHANAGDRAAFRAARYECYRALNAPRRGTSATMTVQVVSPRVASQAASPPVDSLQVVSPQVASPPVASIPSVASLLSLLDWLDDAIDGRPYLYVDAQFARVQEAVARVVSAAEVEVYRAEFFAAALCVGEGVARRVGLLCRECVGRLRGL